MRQTVMRPLLKNGEGAAPESGNSPSMPASDNISLTWLGKRDTSIRLFFIKREQFPYVVLEFRRRVGPNFKYWGESNLTDDLFKGIVTIFHSCQFVEITLSSPP